MKAMTTTTTTTAEFQSDGFLPPQDIGEDIEGLASHFPCTRWLRTADTDVLRANHRRSAEAVRIFRAYGCEAPLIRRLPCINAPVARNPS